MSFLKAGLVFAIPTIGKLLAGLVVVKVIALYLGADGLGRLGQFMSLMTMLTILAGGGIATGVVKYVAEFKNQRAFLTDYVQTASCITLGSSLFIGLILIVLNEKISFFLFNTAEYAPQVKVLAVVQFFIGFSTFLLGILNGFRHVNGFALVNLASVTVGTIGVVLGCAYFNLIGAMYGMMWFSSCQIIFLLIWYQFYFKENWSFLTPKWVPHIAKNFSHFSLMQLISVLTMQMAQVIIRNEIVNKTSWVDVGYWQGLVKISDAYLLFITVVLSNYYMPRLSELSDKKKIIKEVFFTYKTVIPVLLVLIPVIYLCRDLIVVLLYSRKFLVISDLFFIQIIGDFLKVVAYIIGYVAVAKAAYKIYICAEIFQASVLVLLSIILIRNYGILGAVYAYVITYLIYAAVNMFCFYIYSKK